MCEFHDSNGNGLGYIWWTDKVVYFSIIYTRVATHLARSDTLSITCIVARISHSDTQQCYDAPPTNRLSLNVKKSKVCIFSPPKSRYTLGNNSLCVNNVKINFIGENYESIKFLGLHIDEHLTWTKHIAAITSKISKSLFAINPYSAGVP